MANKEMPQEGILVCRKCGKHMEIEEAVVIAKSGEPLKPSSFLCLECFEEEYCPFIN